MEYNPNYLFLHKNWKDYRFFCLQGSARSGKTFSTIDFIIHLCMKYHGAGLEIDICRESLQVLKGTVLKDMINRLTQFGLYNERLHNMSEKVYNLNGNNINYYSGEDEMKARGRKRHIFWGNEPNTFTQDFVRAILIRTSDKCIFDFNPSEPIGIDHWLYDDILKRPNTCTLVTTYKDNPFLSKEQVHEIELLKESDPEYYKVFGLGQRAAIGDVVFSHYTIAALPELADYCFGLDFGFNDPTALMKVGVRDKRLYWKQMLYEPKLTTSDLIYKLTMIIPDKNKEIWADSAEPKTIEEIRRAGFNIKSADKSTILNRIQKIKSLPLIVDPDSASLQIELKNYRWKKDKFGNKMDEPVDYMNHAIDAGGYATWNYLMNQRGNVSWQIV